jgi:hypothetical protein
MKARILLGFLLLFAGSSQCADTNTVVKPAHVLLPGLVQAFPVNFTLPKAFVVASVNDEFKGIDGGVLWAEEKTIQKVKSSKKLSDLPGPAVVIKISDGVMQAGPSTFTIEDKLATSLPLGQLTTNKFNWNGFPVLAFSGRRQNGTMAAGAWVGLNSPDGLALFFDFRGRTRNEAFIPEDSKVWNAILAQNRKP